MEIFTRGTLTAFNCPTETPSFSRGRITTVFVLVYDQHAHACNDGTEFAAMHGVAASVHYSSFCMEASHVFLGPFALPCHASPVQIYNMKQIEGIFGSPGLRTPCCQDRPRTPAVVRVAKGSFLDVNTTVSLKSCSNVVTPCPPACSRPRRKHQMPQMWETKGTRCALLSSRLKPVHEPREHNPSERRLWLSLRGFFRAQTLEKPGHTVPW